MKPSTRYYAWLLGVAVLAFANAQTRIDLRTQGKNVDFSEVPTKPFQTGATLPATCSVGETFFKTDALAGKNFYGCTGTNKWTLQAEAGPELPDVTGQIGKVLTNDGSGPQWSAINGDVSGTAGSLVVQGLQGRSFSAVTPADGDVIKWSASMQKWEPAGEKVTLGGDASGLSGQALIRGLQGRAVSAEAPVNGQTLTWNAQASQWEPGLPSVSLSGDARGSNSDVVVKGLQGRAVASTVPSHNQVLTWDAATATWKPAAGVWADNGATLTATSGRTVVVDALAVGDGTVPGELPMYETTANGNDYVSIKVPNAVSQILRLEFPNAVPNPGDLLTFGALDTDTRIQPLAYTPFPNKNTACAAGKHVAGFGPDNAMTCTDDTAAGSSAPLVFGTTGLGYFQPWTQAGGLSNTAVHAVTDAKFYQMVVPYKITISKIGFSCYTGGTGGFVVGIYNTTTKLAQARQVNPANTTTYVLTIDAAPLTLEPGVYYFAWGSDISATAAITHTNDTYGSPTLPGILNSGTLKRIGYGGTLTGAGATLALPASLPTLTSTNDPHPLAVLLP
jgi:hypothetical protein